MAESIICRTCKEPIVSRAKTNGRECRDCCNARHRARWALRTPEQIACRRAYKHRTYHYTPSGTPRSRQVKWLRRRHGISEAQYEAMLGGQDGKCGICGTGQPNGKWKRFHVDHDHATGKIRGLLCHRCNSGIGLLGDTLEAVARATQYLAAA